MARSVSKSRLLGFNLITHFGGSRRAIGACFFSLSSAIVTVSAQPTAWPVQYAHSSCRTGNWLSWSLRNRQFGINRSMMAMNRTL